jgi:hypothetical protein
MNLVPRSLLGSVVCVLLGAVLNRTVATARKDERCIRLKAVSDAEIHVWNATEPLEAGTKLERVLNRVSR